MPLPESLEEQIVIGMYDRGLLSFTEKDTELQSGRNSPYYYNLQRSLSFSKNLVRSGKMGIARQRQLIDQLARGLTVKFGEIRRPYDHIFGKAQSGTGPMAVAAFIAGRSYLWERVDEPEKTYGIKQKIEGDFEYGERILIADDTTSTGTSIMKGARLLEAAGLEPVAVSLQLDRQEGGVETLVSEHKLEVNSITTISRAARFLVENHRIKSREIEMLQNYHQGLIDDGLVSTFDYVG